MSINELIKELDLLNLPSDSYAITASGPLAVRGIREANNLDIIVTEEVWDDLVRKFPIISDERFQMIKTGNITILSSESDFADNSPFSVVEQINKADTIDGHPYVNLFMLRKIKESLGREKDLRDILLIDNYMTNRAA